jgi:hypothetical protein
MTTRLRLKRNNPTLLSSFMFYHRIWLGQRAQLITEYDLVSEHNLSPNMTWSASTTYQRIWLGQRAQLITEYDLVSEHNLSTNMTWSASTTYQRIWLGQRAQLITEYDLVSEHNLSPNMTWSASTTYHRIWLGQRAQLINEIIRRVTWRMSLVKQELATLPETHDFTPGFSVVLDFSV